MHMMMSHVKVHSSITYHVLLAKFGEIPIELHARKLTIGFQQRFTHLTPSWLINKATSLSRNIAEQGFNTRHKLTTMWMTSWGVSHWETHDNPTTSKTLYVDIKEAFLAKEWNSFHLSRKKLDHLHLKEFLKYECKLYLEQPSTPPQRKITRISTGHPFKTHLTYNRPTEWPSPAPKTCISSMTRHKSILAWKK